VIFIGTHTTGLQDRTPSGRQPRSYWDRASSSQQASIHPHSPPPWHSSSLINRICGFCHFEFIFHALFRKSSACLLVFETFPSLFFTVSEKPVPRSAQPARPLAFAESEPVFVPPQFRSMMAGDRPNQIEPTFGMSMVVPIKSPPRKLPGGSVSVPCEIFESDRIRFYEGPALAVGVASRAASTADNRQRI